MHSRLCRLAEGAVLSLRGDTEPETDDHPAGAQMVQSRDLLGELPWAPASQRRDHGAKPYVAGPRRDRTEQHPRVVHRRPVGGVVLKVVPEEEAVPSGLLSQRREVHQIRRIAGIGHAHTEPHVSSLLTRTDNV